MYELEVFVDGLKSQVDGLRFEVFHQETFVCKEIIFAEVLVIRDEMVDRPYIGHDGVPRQV